MKNGVTYKIILAGVGALAVIGVIEVASKLSTQSSAGAKKIPDPVEMKIIHRFKPGQSSPPVTDTVLLEILTLVDNIKLQDIIINRGHCRVTQIPSDFDTHLTLAERREILEENFKLGGINLTYGGIVRFDTSCDEILEVILKTDKGEVTKVK
jgi:hypothetical protein